MLVLLPIKTTNFTAIYRDVSSGNASAASMNQTLYLAYGMPAHLSLLPCPSALNILSPVATCAAAAVQIVAGNSSILDVSVKVSVADVSANISSRCSAIAMTSGSCLPGIYTLRYTVLGVSAFLTIHIEQRKAATFAYQFPLPVTNT